MLHDQPGHLPGMGPTEAGLAPAARLGLCRQRQACRQMLRAGAVEAGGINGFGVPGYFRQRLAWSIFVSGTPWPRAHCSAAASPYSLSASRTAGQVRRLNKATR